MNDQELKQLESLLKQFIKDEVDKGNVYKLESMAETLQRIRFRDLGKVGLTTSLLSNQATDQAGPQSGLNHASESKKAASKPNLDTPEEGRDGS